MRPVRVMIVTAVSLLVLAVVAGLAFIYAGIYNVGASRPEGKVTGWILETVAENSVSQHAKGIQAPNLSATGMIRQGFAHYREMCVVCHGAPGQEATEIALGLNPPAPNLGAAANDLTPAELFWVTKNGIKMTGMPSFGATHSDDKIWLIVAFLERLRTLTQAEYEAMSAAAGSLPEEGGKRMP